MIYVFEAQGAVMPVRVDDSRDLWFTGPAISQEWVSFDRLAENADKHDVGLVKAIIKNLPEEFHERYLVDEMARAGFKHLKTVSEAEYGGSGQ